jgi:tetratricopeptide (TPR) repeat protein
LEIAQRALYSNHLNEKIYFDLAKLNFFRQEFVLAREYALISVALNKEMDIAFDLLADIEMKLDGNLEQAMIYRAKAVSLSPDSSQNHIDMAMALARQGNLKEASRHYLRAKTLYPKIAELNPSYIQELEVLLYG